MHNVVALLSGGKDSCFAIIQCLAHGHNVVAVATLTPDQSIDESTNQPVDEIDSHMFQTVGHSYVKLIAECMGLPYYSRAITGMSSCTKLDYEVTVNDEIEDLYRLIESIKAEHPAIDAVCSGAIESNYQRLRVENVASRLSLTSLAYLWKRDQAEVMHEMVETHVDARLIKVASQGLNATHINQSIEQMLPTLERLNREFGANVAGEGGEFESFVFDAPNFTKRLEVTADDWEVVTERGTIDPVSLMRIKRMRCVPKPIDPSSSQSADTADTLSTHPAIKSCPNFVLSQSLLKSHPPLPMLGPSVNQSTVQPKGLFPISRTCGDLLFISNGATLTQSVDHSTTHSPAYDESFSALLKHVPANHSMMYLSLLIPNMLDFVPMNSAYVKHINQSIGQSPVPSRATVQSKVTHVQADILAVKHNQSNRRFDHRVLHVQSISEWAPACIGPYSQSNELAGCVFVAGQIPLQPCSMILRNDEEGLMFSWKHVNQILKTHQSNLTDVCNAIVWMDKRCKHQIQSVHQSSIKQLISEDQSINQATNQFSAFNLYVFVDALPRSSMIEVQVMAATSKMNGRLRRSINQSINTRLMYISDTFASCMIHINRSTDQSVDESIEMIHQGLEHTRSTAHLQSIHQWIMRIYYVPDECDISVWEQKLFDSFNNQSINQSINQSSLPAISFIPTDGLMVDASTDVSMIVHTVYWELDEE